VNLFFEICTSSFLHCCGGESPEVVGHPLRLPKFGDAPTKGAEEVPDKADRAGAQSLIKQGELILVKCVDVVKEVADVVDLELALQ